jgi:hypothetical protein
MGYFESHILCETLHNDLFLGKIIHTNLSLEKMLTPERNTLISIYGIYQVQMRKNEIE